MDTKKQLPDDPNGTREGSGLYAYCPVCEESAKPGQSQLCRIVNLSLVFRGLSEVVLHCPVHKTVVLRYDNNTIVDWLYENKDKKA